ncbi:MAG: hypothetical protein RBS91_05100 [Sulfurimonadaceae bacterium]|jgi:acyl carrier protein|nr:hypothetical protein [Sulfurimonadaceae bacterium]
MQEKIENIIYEALKELNEELENETFLNPNLKTKLYGGSGAMDSLALVSFIADVEEKISIEFNKDIVLADEKAMSQKTSPFRDVQSLSSYILELLKQN